MKNGVHQEDATPVYPVSMTMSAKNRSSMSRIQARDKSGDRGTTV